MVLVWRILLSHLLICFCYCHAISIPIRTLTKNEIKRKVREFRLKEMKRRRTNVTRTSGYQYIEGEDEKGPTVYVSSYLTNVFYSTISIGSPPQVFKVMYDTLTHPLWVPEHDTDQIRCHAMFDINTSNTNGKDSRKFKINLMESMVSGFFIKDNVQISDDVTIEEQIFGLMTRITSPYYMVAPFDGVFGLNFRQDSDDPYSPIEKLLDHKVITNRMIGIYLNTSEIDPMSGVITLGHVNKKYYTGKFDRYFVVHRADEGLQWRINQTSFVVEEKNICKMNSSFCDVVFATSAPKIYAPTDIAYELNLNLGATRRYFPFPVDKQVWQVSCKLFADNQIPEILIKIKDKKYTMPPENFISKVRMRQRQYCLTDIEDGERPYIVFGVPFFKSYFVKLFWDEPNSWVEIAKRAD